MARYRYLVVGRMVGRLWELIIGLSSKAGKSHTRLAAWEMKVGVALVKCPSLLL